ncbi:NAD binding domain of 6-phosphogluconate dehydrogenase family protein [Escherichia coli 1-250-04_S4_C1]|nr:NAD binding domain of 6-phosphogluconate dehydrogenase family protein [Escherichia coli 1-250-04_S4_C2]EZJ50391.1 NAD binding domain of 6-phosphogluconate dehydrogenase family protein [Escherichia coli 1-250-04_S4_C1]STD45157.1 oxidoreductase with NAD(P)-binding Rossmann-fold domain, 3-hydroxyisobutyrate dehydrogenase [Escherichia coli]
MATIAFLGLGQMGSPMANNLLQKGIHCRYLMSMHRPSMR